MGNLLNDDFLDQERKNREKYGSRENDLISECFRKGIDIGNTWCLINSKKYIDRFLSKSGKGGNLMDLLKATDYIQRAYTASKENGTFDKKEEIIDNQIQKDINAWKTVDKELKQNKDQHSNMTPYQEGYNDFNNEGCQVKNPLEYFCDNQAHADDYKQGYKDAADKHNETQGDKVKMDKEGNLISGPFPNKSSHFMQGYNDYPNRKKGTYIQESSEKDYIDGFALAHQHNNDQKKKDNDELENCEEEKSKDTNSIRPESFESMSSEEKLEYISGKHTRLSMPLLPDSVKAFALGYDDYPNMKEFYKDKIDVDQYNEGFELAHKTKQTDKMDDDEFKSKAKFYEFEGGRQNAEDDEESPKSHVVSEEVTKTKSLPYSTFDKETPEFQKGYNDFPVKDDQEYVSHLKQTQYNKGFLLAKAHNTQLP